MMKRLTVCVLCLCFLCGMTARAAEASPGDMVSGNMPADVSAGDAGTVDDTDVSDVDAIDDAAASDTTVTVTQGTFEVPDVTGMNYRDADAALSQIPVEVIHKFAASDTEAEDEVISQSAVGTVEDGSIEELILTISQGPEDKAVKMSQNTPRGISGVVSGKSNIVIDGDFSDWADKPFSWEYNYDNSNEVWGSGFPVNGEMVRCEKPNFNLRVRHKFSLYCDGENVYVYFQCAESAAAGSLGGDYVFTIDGTDVRFRLLAYEIDAKTPGIYTVDVKDVKTYTLADGAVARMLVHEGGVNNELEVMIPLATMQMQKPEINLDNIDTIQFKAEQLMYRPITTSGADTMPFVWAVLALILVPGSAYAIRRYYLKRQQKANA